ncbi:MAG: CBS domain-containing protein [Kofleriaceae bacterium]|nr:MAG: CBS domain-containing protein [Kofleriaceae bacterium]
MKPTPTLRLRRVIHESGTADDTVIALRAATGASVASIMSRTTYCLRPQVGVRTAVGILLDERMSGAPVVDDEGHPVGIVSKTDLLRHLHERGDAVESGDDPAIERGYHATDVDSTTVGDVMMPVVFAIAEDTTIAAASALMAGEGIHRLPVLDKKGAVVGILSTLDIVRCVADRAGYHV